MRSSTFCLEADLIADVHPYATLAYARTLAHVGRPLYVPAWNTFVIMRDWNARATDAVGPYPITCIAPGSDLELGLESLRQAGLVSVTLVVDGLLGPPNEALRKAFTCARPFKTHYMVDKAAGSYEPSKHHRYEIRRAAKRGVEIRVVPLVTIIDAWAELYDGLIARHRVTGVQRFPRESFVALTECSGLWTVAAYIASELVSCHLWFQYEDCAWSHLAATSELGYVSGAAYAVYDHAIRNFAGRLINLGGTAGTQDAAADTLARFKAGFANRRSDAYLCGAVLDAATYHALCAERAGTAGDYFPAYRTPLGIAC